MSYKIDELFRFEEFLGECAIRTYYMSYDPSVTEIEIPAEYNGKPVTTISAYVFHRSQYIKRVVIPPSVRVIVCGAFLECSALESVEISEGVEAIGPGAFANTNLKEIVLPKSLKEIDNSAFMSCKNLERVELNSEPNIKLNAFCGCDKLPPETVAMGIVCSTDLTSPVFGKERAKIAGSDPSLPLDCFRPDVFELLAKNDCFRGLNIKSVFCQIIDANKPEVLKIADQYYNMLMSERLVDKLISYSAEHQRVECTAFLLDLKNRRFRLGGMNGLNIYTVDELFRFTKNEDENLGGYAVKYYKARDKNVTEVEIPAEYNGEPVTAIAVNGFCDAKYLRRVVVPPSVRVIDVCGFLTCRRLETIELSEGLEIIEHGAFNSAGLKSIVLPKSLKRLRDCAFEDCRELESVIFNSKPKFGKWIFTNCIRLPAEYALMDLVHSCDISDPVDAEEYNTAFPHQIMSTFKYTRPDVLALAAKNDCFRNVDRFLMLKFLIDGENEESLRAAGENGIFDTRELIDKCIEYSIGLGKTEITAYLLDLKNRKFGFNGGGDFEL